MTHEEAVRVWIARRYAARSAVGRPIADVEIADVRFGVGEGWGGSDVTPGEEDYAAVQFRVRLAGGEWKDADMYLTSSPAQLVAECLAIYEEAAAGSPTTPRVDAAIAHVQGAHWGGSLTCPAPSVTREVFMRWVREARTLASEVRRLRTLAGLASRRDAP